MIKEIQNTSKGGEGKIASSFVNLLKWRESVNLRVLNMVGNGEKRKRDDRFEEEKDDTPSNHEPRPRNAIGEQN